MASSGGFSDMLRSLGDWLGIFLVVAAVSGVVIGIAYFIWDYNVDVENSRAQIALEKQKVDASLELEKMKFPPFVVACYDMENRLIFALKGLGNPDFHPNNATGNMCLGDICAHCSTLKVPKSWEALQRAVTLKKPVSEVKPKAATKK